jgi:hypothetical protein
MDEYNFEQFRRPLRGQLQGEEPIIAISWNGTIQFSHPAIVALGMPKSIVLLYDKNKRIIGIRAAGEDDGKYDRYDLAEISVRVYRIISLPFVRLIGHDESKTIYLHASIRDGILCAALP